MQIDFTKLQKQFIKKIRKEDGLSIEGQEVSFVVQPNCGYEKYNLKIYLSVFGEEFSVGYAKE